MPDAVFSKALADDSAAARREPSSDGLALVGSALHSRAIMRTLEALSRHFRTQPGPEPFMSIHQPMCHDPSDLRRHVMPDLLVAHDGWDRTAPAYHLWEAPTPHFVLEIASRSTVDRDLGFKKEEYERMGVLEYWQLDQSGTLLPTPLLGHRLTEQGYRELQPSGLVDGREAYHSAALGLLVRSRGHGFGLELVFRNPQSGKDILAGDDMNRAYDAVCRERHARTAAVREFEAERSKRLAVEERLAQVEEALRRVLARTGSDLD